jgi:FKBP-type peptidyl-prolyl cis-trans isomerase 2
MKKLIFPAVLIAVVLISGCTGDTGIQACSPENTVAAGDHVRVQYVGTLEDGTLFDEGEINFTSMAGEMIEGFDEAVAGMCLGEEKNVTIPPEKAYPYYPEMVETMPLVVELDKMLTVSVESFNESLGSYPEVGKTYFDPNVHIMPLKVTEIADGNVTMEKIAELNSSIRGVEPWPLDVINVTEDKIFLRRNVTDGETIQTYMGPKTLSVSGGELTLDMNMQLAGRTLVFYVKVLELDKA